MKNKQCAEVEVPPTHDSEPCWLPIVQDSIPQCHGTSHGQYSVPTYNLWNVLKKLHIYISIFLKWKILILSLSPFPLEMCDQKVWCRYQKVLEDTRHIQAMPGESKLLPKRQFGWNGFKDKFWAGCGQSKQSWGRIRGEVLLCVGWSWKRTFADIFYLQASTLKFETLLLLRHFAKPK